MVTPGRDGSGDKQMSRASSIHYPPYHQPQSILVYDEQVLVRGCSLRPTKPIEGASRLHRKVPKFRDMRYNPLQASTR